MDNHIFLEAVLGVVNHGEAQTDTVVGLVPVMQNVLDGFHMVPNLRLGCTREDTRKRQKGQNNSS